MNEVQRALYKSVVQPALRQRVHDIRATVIVYDEFNNTATVEFTSVYGAGTTIFESVPVQIGSGGVHSAGPFVGDEVWVSFVNGDPQLPQIVALADRQYSYVTRERRIKHTKKGAYVPDSICGR